MHRIYQTGKRYIYRLLSLRLAIQDYQNENEYIYCGSDYGGWPIHNLLLGQELNIVAAGAERISPSKLSYVRELIYQM